ncbi:MAG: hypothetical protein ACYDCC_04000 [Actinomycetota bacterium]
MKGRGMVVHEEHGIAMVSVMIVSMIAMMLSVVIVNQSIHSLNGTAVDRSRTQGIESAEAALGIAYQQIGAATSYSSLPCGSGAITGSLTSAPTAESYSVTINYYDTYPPTDAALTCSAVQAGAVTPIGADVTATGQNNQTGISQKRAMDALVKLTANPNPAFSKAIFSNSSMSGVNNATIYGYSGNDADVYTNGSITCSNSFMDHGSVYAQGSFTGNNSCVVAVDVYTKTGVTLSNSASIGNNVTVSQGNVTLSNNAVINNQAFASGSVTVNSPATIVHGYVANATGLADPPQLSFPVLNYNQTDWTNAGYTAITDNNCTASGVYTDISNMATATSNTVIYTTCALSWSGNTTININHNLTIFSTGGFTMQNQTFWGSADGGTHILDFIVPYSAATMPCTSPGISLSNNTSFAQQVNIFWYTPCQMTISNNTTGYGQVYAGSVDPTNNYTQHYVPISIPGQKQGGQALYSVGIGYEREVLPS